ncbi:MAG: hypothetical protein ACXWZB_09145 [Gaiellaceae bacterium]
MSSVPNEVSVGRQALRRKVNDGMRQAIDWGDAGAAVIFSECGGRLCAERVTIPAAEYADVLATQGRFVVALAHADASAVESSGDGYAIVSQVPQ